MDLGDSIPILAQSRFKQISEIEINPYEILDLDESMDKNSQINASKHNFRNKIQNESMTYFKRKQLALARQILMKPVEYQKVPGQYKYKYVPNIFHFAASCDFRELVPLLQDEIKLKLEISDERKQGLLYLATQPGYKIMILYLLQKGININQVQQNGSTPLHIACFNGHIECIDILLLNGAEMKIQNQFGHMPIEEAYQPKEQKINELFKKHNFLRENNQIYEKIHDLRKKELISLAYTLYNEQGEEFGIFVQPNYNQNPIQREKLQYVMNNPNNVHRVYHGTKLLYLETILKNGLLKPSERGQSKLDTGKIQLGRSYRGFDNWADAVFLTSSPYYASQKLYSQTFSVKNIKNGNHVDQEYYLVLQCSMSENSQGKQDVYSSEKHTMGKYDLAPNEPEFVEFRVNDSSKILVTGIYFFNKQCIQDLNDCQKSMELLNEKGKIDGIYSSSENTHKVSVQYWKLCLMGHTLKKQEQKQYECDACGQNKNNNNYHCDKCSFTRCERCYKSQKLL